MIVTDGSGEEPRPRLLTACSTSSPAEEPWDRPPRGREHVTIAAISFQLACHQRHVDPGFW